MLCGKKNLNENSTCSELPKKFIMPQNRLWDFRDLVKEYGVDINLDIKDLEFVIFN